MSPSHTGPSWIHARGRVTQRPSKTIGTRLGWRLCEWLSVTEHLHSTDFSFITIGLWPMLTQPVGSQCTSQRGDAALSTALEEQRRWAPVCSGQTEKQWWGQKRNDAVMADDMTGPDGGIHLGGDKQVLCNLQSLLTCGVTCCLSGGRKYCKTLIPDPLVWTWTVRKLFRAYLWNVHP